MPSTLFSAAAGLALLSQFTGTNAGLLNRRQFGLPQCYRDDAITGLFENADPDYDESIVSITGW